MLKHYLLAGLVILHGMVTTVPEDHWVGIISMSPGGVYSFDERTPGVEKAVSCAGRKVPCEMEVMLTPDGSYIKRILWARKP